MSKIRLSVRENVLSNPALVTQKMYEDYLELSGRGWVCELDGNIIGFSYAASADHSIWALFVDPNFEGLGAGKELLRLSSQWLFENGATSVKLGTSVNSRAERFYLAQGWIRGEMKTASEVSFRLDSTTCDMSMDIEA
ncbi:GNAT family N-acetyltransferase [Undibacterium sp. LX15W]|uniref:GNAT family N-acetyltransferase n=2 Tax=Undibacterium flavidum TaxID=2762297 RepID=A0ABR6Y616_9BURK|nr:GNAT family N-acetyltransferase [Undibacterium flavidum]